MGVRGQAPGGAGLTALAPRSAIHLCNNSIQKHLKNDKGRSPLLPYHNMWTSTRFREYLQKRGRGAVWVGVIYPAMKRAVANTMRVAQDRVEPRKNSFELYGADFVLGRDFQPWLIEINSSPTMHASTPVTAQLCAQVQEDTIKVVLDRRADRSCDIGNFELLWRQVRGLGAGGPGWPGAGWGGTVLRGCGGCSCFRQRAASGSGPPGLPPPLSGTPPPTPAQPPSPLCSTPCEPQPPPALWPPGGEAPLPAPLLGGPWHPGPESRVFLPDLLCPPPPPGEKGVLL